MCSLVSRQYFDLKSVICSSYNFLIYVTGCCPLEYVFMTKIKHYKSLLSTCYLCLVYLFMFPGHSFLVWSLLLHLYQSLNILFIFLKTFSSKFPWIFHLLFYVSRPYILYLLHRVGAKRCPPGVSGCKDGCEPNGTFNGTPLKQEVLTPTHHKKGKLSIRIFDTQYLRKVASHTR